MASFALSLKFPSKEMNTDMLQQTLVLLPPSKDESQGFGEDREQGAGTQGSDCCFPGSLVSVGRVPLTTLLQGRIPFTCGIQQQMKCEGYSPGPSAKCL